MGGRGSTSATARIAAIVENNREAFGRIAERAERNANVGFSRTLAETARAAESLVGTERAAALLADSALKSIRREIEGAHGKATVSVLSDIRRMTEPGLDNRPMRYSLDEWDAAKTRVRAAMGELAAKGYSEADVAAALAYKERISPGGIRR